MKHLSTVIAIAVVVALDVVFVRWVINGDGDAVTQWAIGLVLGLVSMLFAWAVVRFVASAAKGRIEIDTPDDVLNPGDRLDGTITVHARPQLDAERLTVALVATVTNYQYLASISSSVSLSVRTQPPKSGPDPGV